MRRRTGSRKGGSRRAVFGTWMVPPFAFMMPNAMEALVALAIPFVPPAALAVLGVSLRRHGAGPRWGGTVLLAIGIIGLLLVAAVQAVFLTTFDPS